MKYLRFIWRVLRRMVWETATDQTTGLAAQMAYLLLFALAPGSLFLWHLLGLFGTDPSKLHRMFLLLKSFMPPDTKVQDILDSAMANVVVTGSSAASVDWIPECAIDRVRPDCSGARALSAHARKLFDHSSGVAGRDFLCGRLDRRDETFPVLRGKIRSIQPDISGAGVHRCAAHLDVSDLSAVVVGRQIERHPSSRTRANAQGGVGCAGACGGELKS